MTNQEEIVELTNKAIHYRKLTEDAHTEYHKHDNALADIDTLLQHDETNMALQVEYAEKAMEKDAEESKMKSYSYLAQVYAQAAIKAALSNYIQGE